MLKPGIRTSIDNEEYIELGNRIDIYNIPYDGAPLKVKVEIQCLLDLVKDYEIKNVRAARNLVIRKDSLLGAYILNLPSEKMANFDNEVTFDDVINALNIAIFENDSIAKDIVVLFQKQVSGSKMDLVSEYGLEVIEYILKNNNFGIYLEKLNGEYLPEEYLVYEYGRLIKRTILKPQNQKIKVETV